MAAGCGVGLAITDDIATIDAPEADGGIVLEPGSQLALHERQPVVCLFARSALPGIKGEETSCPGQSAAGPLGCGKSVAQTGHGAKEAGILLALQVKGQVEDDLAATIALSGQGQYIKIIVIHDVCYASQEGERDRGN